MIGGAGFRNQGSGFRIRGAGFRNQGSGFRIKGVGFRDQNPGFRIMPAMFVPPSVVPILAKVRARFMV
jgi:hypothetical protein